MANQLAVVVTLPVEAALVLAERTGCQLHVLISRILRYGQHIYRVTNRQLYGLQAVVENSRLCVCQTVVIRVRSNPFSTHNHRIAPVNRVVVTDLPIGLEQIRIRYRQFQTIDRVTTIDRVALLLVIVVEIEGRIHLDLRERTIGLAVPGIGLVVGHRVVVHMQERLGVPQLQMIDRVAAQTCHTRVIVVSRIG